MATKDIDWFNKDSVYTAAAGNSLADLTSQLAQILSNRDNGYSTMNQQNDQLAQSRTQDLTTLGGDEANRGLQDSGLYAQSADKTGTVYANKQNALDLARNQFQQQYGMQGSPVNLGALKSLAGKNSIKPNAGLAQLYGSLGSNGLTAGNSYNEAISAAKAASAARSAKPLVQTVKW